LLGVRPFLDQSRNDKRRARVGIIPAAIEVHRQEEDGIKPVLLPIGLGLDQHHLLSWAIGCIRFFQIAFPEVSFFKGHRREFGVGADGAKGHEFFYAEESGLLHELRSHNQVLVEETSQIFAAPSNFPHNRRQMDDDIGLDFFKQPGDGLFSGEFVPVMTGTKVHPAARFFNFFYEVGPEKAGSSGHHNSALSPKNHCQLLSERFVEDPFG